MSTTLEVTYDKEYWTGELELPLPGFHLYSDYPAMVSGRTVKETRTTIDSTNLNLNKLDKQYQVHTWLLSNYIVFLYRISGDKDLLIGVSDNKDGILPVRIVLSGTETFQEIYHQVAMKRRAIEATDLTFLQLEKMMDQSITLHALYGDKITHNENGVIHFSLQQESTDRWTLSIKYAEEFYESSTIYQFSNHYLHLMNETMYQVHSSIDRIPMVTSEDLKSYAELNHKIGRAHV